uniref:Aminotransferase-like plant mobile domain-containing protein n=1 Tax=Oryza punctata TaxID=4537 RepID=A0A0E0JVR9_ORYPU
MGGRPPNASKQQPFAPEAPLPQSQYGAQELTQDEKIAMRNGDMIIICSPKQYAETIQLLSKEQQETMKLLGLGGLLNMKVVTLRRIMLVKIAKTYTLQSHCFVLGGREIPIFATDVYKVMDLPIKGTTKKKINDELFNQYKTAGKAHISLQWLRDNILRSKKVDEDFIRQIVLYTICVILAPTTYYHVDSKYLSLVENVSDIPKLNWGTFTLSHLLGSASILLFKKTN